MQIAAFTRLPCSITNMPSMEEAAPQQAAAEVARLQPAASERSPEVVGLADAARLTDDFDALLPLGADGGAALPDSPAARESALRAMLKVGGAIASCDKM